MDIEEFTDEELFKEHAKVVRELQNRGFNAELKLLDKVVGLRVKIVWIHQENLGERFDEEENFAGHETKNTVKETTVSYKEVGKILQEIGDTAADWGDGVTDAKVVLVMNAETKEVLPKNIEYWTEQECN